MLNDGQSWCFVIDRDRDQQSHLGVIKRGPSVCIFEQLNNTWMLGSCPFFTMHHYVISLEGGTEIRAFPFSKLRKMEKSEGT